MLELASLCPLQLPKRMSLLQCLRVNRDKCMHRIYDHIWCDRMCRLSSTFQAKRKTNKKRGLLIGSDTEGCREHKVAYSLQLCYLQWILLRFDFAHSFQATRGARFLPTIVVIALMAVTGSMLRVSKELLPFISNRWNVGYLNFL